MEVIPDSVKNKYHAYPADPDGLILKYVYLSFDQIGNDNDMCMMIESIWHVTPANEIKYQNSCVAIPVQ